MYYAMAFLCTSVPECVCLFDFVQAVIGHHILQKVCLWEGIFWMNCWHLFVCLCPFFLSTTLSFPTSPSISLLCLHFLLPFPLLVFFFLPPSIFPSPFLFLPPFPLLLSPTSLPVFCLPLTLLFPPSFLPSLFLLPFYKHMYMYPHPVMYCCLLQRWICKQESLLPFWLSKPGRSWSSVHLV